MFKLCMQQSASCERSMTISAPFSSRFNKCTNFGHVFCK